MMTVLFGLLALAAIVVAFIYRAAFWRIERCASGLRESFKAAKKETVAYREAGYESETSLIAKRGELRDAFRQLASVTEERDALLVRAASLSSAVSCWRAHLKNYARELRKTACDVDRDGVNMDKRTHAQDEQPGEEERASAEKEEQCRVTEESFRAEVEAAGLQSEFHGGCWQIMGGANNFCISCWPDDLVGLQFRTRVTESNRFGTLAQAIELAGPPVGTD